MVEVVCLKLLNHYQVFLLNLFPISQTVLEPFYNFIALVGSFLDDLVHFEYVLDDPSQIKRGDGSAAEKELLLVLFLGEVVPKGHIGQAEAFIFLEVVVV